MPDHRWRNAVMRTTAAGRIRAGYGWFVLGAAALWLVYDLARRLSAGRWHWSILLDASPPLFLVGIPLVLLASSALARGRQRTLAAVIAVLGVLPGITQTGVNLDALSGARPTVPAGAIHVVSWNTDQFGMGNQDPEAKFTFLKQQNADLYLIQEHSKWTPGLG